jgi:hypothetical protein
MPLGRRKKKDNETESEESNEDTSDEYDIDSNDSDRSDEYTDDSIDDSEESCDIIFECNEIAITNLSEYWVHVITEEQWGIILNNIDRKMMYISAFSFTDIRAGDIVLIYQKSSSPTKPGGFVAIAETSIDMVENDGTLDPNNKRNPSGMIKVYRDQNMNRYVTRLCTMTIFDTPIEHSVLEGVIAETDSEFKSVRQFVLNVITGDCRFQMLDSQTFGLGVVKKLYEESQNQMTETPENGSEDPEEIDSTTEPETETENNFDETDTEYEQQFERQFEQNGFEESSDIGQGVPHLDTDIDLDSESTIDMVGAPLQGEIKPNVPILLVPCSELPSQVKKLQKIKNKVQMIYHHYINCEDCDITNNNSRELTDSIKTVGIHNIKYIVNDHVDALLSYLVDDTYPKINIDEEIKPIIQHHITFYRIQTDPIYSECILIDFTSRVKRILTVDEARSKIQNKSSPISRIMAKPVKQSKAVKMTKTPKHISTTSSSSGGSGKGPILSSESDKRVEKDKRKNRIFVRQKRVVKKTPPSSRMSTELRPVKKRPPTRAVKQLYSESDKRKVVKGGQLSNTNSKVKKVRRKNRN